MQTILTKKYLLLSLVLIGAVAILFLVPWSTNIETIEEKNSYNEIVNELSTLQNISYQAFFEKNMDTIFKQEGMHGLIYRSIDAFKSGQIDMFTCHSLAHDIGHYAGYPDYFDTIETYITKESLDFCGSGFMHGVEGQLANNEYPENINDLYKFCKLTQPFTPYYNGCYHGAGHSFMENTKNPSEALDMCNKLIIDESIVHDDCYRGVFSENVNYTMSQGGSYQDLIIFCDSLTSERMHRLCSAELHGLGLSELMTVEDVNSALTLCTTLAKNVTVQKGCVESVATVSTDRFVGQGKSVEFPVAVTSLNQELFQAYLTSVFGTLSKTTNLMGVGNDAVLCESIDDESRRDACKQQI